MMGEACPPPSNSGDAYCRVAGPAVDACDYRGTLSTTRWPSQDGLARQRARPHIQSSLCPCRYGQTCQSWSANYPHNHSQITAELYPDGGLGDHNYCRNPDRSEDTAWCYTTDPEQRREDCDLPSSRRWAQPSTGTQRWAVRDCPARCPKSDDRPDRGRTGETSLSHG